MITPVIAATTSRVREVGISEFDELVGRWVDHMTLMGGGTGSPHSARARRGDIQRFAQVMGWPAGTSPAVTDLTQEAVTEAVTALKRSDYAQATQRRTWTHFKLFTKHLRKMGVLDEDPCVDIEVAFQASASGEIADLEQKHFSDDEMARLRGEIARQVAESSDETILSGGRWPRRDRAIVEVLRGTGVRRAELAGLRVGNVGLNDPLPMLRVRIGAKGGKGRDVPLPDYTVEVVREYLNDRERLGTAESGLLPDDSSPLFVRLSHPKGRTLDVRPVDGAWLYRRLGSLLREAGITKSAGALVHAFRHTAALGLTARDAPVFLVQQILGHADPKTSSGYAKFSGVAAASKLRETGWLSERPEASKTERDEMPEAE